MKKEITINTTVEIDQEYCGKRCRHYAAMGKNYSGHCGLFSQPLLPSADGRDFRCSGCIGYVLDADKEIDSAEEIQGIMGELCLVSREEAEQLFDEAVSAIEETRTDAHWLIRADKVLDVFIGHIEDNEDNDEWIGSRDPYVIANAVGASDELHSFIISAHKHLRKSRHILGRLVMETEDGLYRLAREIVKRGEVGDFFEIVKGAGEQQRINIAGVWYYAYRLIA